MEFSQPTRYHFQEAKIEGVKDDVVGIIQEFHVFENIMKGSLEGYMVILDSDFAGVLEKYKLEFSEKFNFSFKNAIDETYEIEAYLNGIEAEYTAQSRKMMKIGFISKSGRMNSMLKVYKCYDGISPTEIGTDIASRLQTPITTGKSTGQPIYMMGGGKNPLDVMRYVCSHSVVDKSQVKVKEGTSTGTSSGTTGFLFWETIDGFRMCAIDEMLNDVPYNTFNEYKLHIANRDASLYDQVISVLSYEFPTIGDIQSKLQSGSFGSLLYSMDIDSGEYKEIKFKSDMMTDKMMDIIGDYPSRYFNMVFSNQYKSDKPPCKNKEEEGKEENKYDQSRKYLQQYHATANSLLDQHGRFEIPLRLSMRAGDLFELKMGKMSSKSVPEYDKKHSGKYLIKQVGHHMYITGQGYTKISTIRTTKQQDDETS